MSNEYKDWSNDVMDTLNTKMAEADLLPSGWVNTFIPNLKQELASALGSYVYDFEVLQIKDKYATMRVFIVQVSPLKGHININFFYLLEHLHYNILLFILQYLQ